MFDREGMMPIPHAGKIAVLDLVCRLLLENKLGTLVRNRVEFSAHVLQVMNHFAQQDRTREQDGLDVQGVVDEHDLSRVIECHHPAWACAESLLNLLMWNHVDLGQDLRRGVSG